MLLWGGSVLGVWSDAVLHLPWGSEGCPGSAGPLGNLNPIKPNGAALALWGGLPGRLASKKDLKLYLYSSTVAIYSQIVRVGCREKSVVAITTNKL